MTRLYVRLLLTVSMVGTPAPFAGDTAASQRKEQLWTYRNLGKAFYENPTTQQEAVEQFRLALALNPRSARERVNYGLALLRAGKTADGIAELQRAQKQDASIPHTWFNLGIARKRESANEQAIEQLEGFVRLRPADAVAHFNLGYLYKLAGKSDVALQHFETAAAGNPNLAGPHFQLYTAYRIAGRSEDAAREQKLFQEIKKRQAGAAVPEDLEWNYYSEIYDEPDPSPQTPPESLLRFEMTRISAAWSGADMIVFDADGDARPDLLTWSDQKVELWKGGVTPLSSTGLAILKGARAVAAADFDNDGLSDLAAVTPSGAVFLRNRKTEFEQYGPVVPGTAFRKAVWIDYDHDYDLDLLLVGSQSRLLRNNGQSGFSDVTAEFPFVSGTAADAVAFAAVPDTDERDVLVVYEDGAAVLYRDKLAGRFEAQKLSGFPQGIRSITAEDWDNDSWTDLLLQTAGGQVLMHNQGGQFASSGSPVDLAGPAIIADLENRGVTDLAVAGTVLRRSPGKGFVSGKSEGLSSWLAVQSADFDGDGRTDIAAARPDGDLAIFFNRSASAHKWLQVGLTGVRNLRIPYGADVEVKAGSTYQKKTYRHLPLLFGLGANAVADTVRITWPNGLVQNEMRQDGSKAHTFKEAQRLSGSCPMIFTWNGREYEFVTDILGVAPLGAASTDGGYFPVDHDEYVQIPGSSLVPRAGRFEVRITEELREVSYLDQIRLIAVDHPSGTTIVTNDKFKPPPFPEFRLFGIRNRTYPVGAVDDAGADVLERLTRKDRRYADTFRRDARGVASLHGLDLDFGPAAPDNRSVLVLSGWVDWPDGSTFKAVDQERRRGLIFPYLQVRDADGKWRTVIEDMGIPAGKPKTIAVDLTNKFLSSSREIRIVSDLCLYWDEIYLSEQTASPNVTLTDVPLASAQLRFAGFARPVIHPERRQPEHFVYSQRLPVSSWNPIPGSYTRYGDTTPLLAAVDDRMVIMGAGDELALEFNARSLPSVTAGCSRDFLLFVDGWAKDGDANTAYARTVEPLPFHAMTVYPYAEGERFPNHLQEWQRTWNTRPALRLLRPLAAEETQR